MNLPTEFKGTIYAHYSVKYGHTAFIDTDLSGDGDYILLGSVDVDMKFDRDIAAQEIIESLGKQIEEEKAASFRRVQVLQGKIESLRALEHIA